MLNPTKATIGATDKKPISALHIPDIPAAIFTCEQLSAGRQLAEAHIAVVASKTATSANVNFNAVFFIVGCILKYLCGVVHYYNTTKVRVFFISPNFFEKILKKKFHRKPIVSQSDVNTLV